MIVGSNIRTDLVINIKFFVNGIECGIGPYLGCTTPMLDFNYYYFKLMMINTLESSGELFMNAYTQECCG